MTNLMSERARRMRRDKGPAERELCHLLREFNRYGFQFRQQAPIGPYISDFCDHSARFVVEVDGSQHDEPQQRVDDQRALAWLESQGYRVLRFWNHEVLKNIGGVEIAIMVALGLLTEDGDDPVRSVRSRLPHGATTEEGPPARSPESGLNASFKATSAATVPSPLVGEGQGGGRLAPTSEFGAPPHPNPSPQAGRGSRGARHHA